MLCQKRFDAASNLRLLSLSTAAVIALALAALSGCSSVPQTPPTARTQAQSQAQYCGDYMSYAMCVRDIDRDGEVDLIYFADTREIFMIAPGYDRGELKIAEHHHDSLPREEYGGLGIHRCLQPMDNAMRNASSQLLELSDDAGLLRRTQVKSRLLLNYARYLPAINRCMGSDNTANSGLANSSSTDGDDTFGDEDFEAL